MRPLALLLATAAMLPAAAPPTKPAVSGDHAKVMTASRELFAKKVRAILSDNCLKCHGGEKTKAALDITTREALLEGADSGAVVVPGMAKASKFYRLAAKLDDPHMPPKSEKKSLTAEQLADLAKWIDLGAAYDKPLLARADKTKKPMTVTDEDRKFWSFRPLSRPAVPEVKSPAVARNAVDRFVLAKLEERGLSFAHEADHRTLVRRLTFDLTGLPPSPEATEAFVQDTSPDAYERLVDRLLASPAHGERWARHWLDVARFAESHGFEHDYDRPNAWPYRDFVIRALNDDLPFTDFVRWQIAGDEFAPDNPLALSATGFLGAGVHSTQITANTVEKERYDELDDIVRTTGTAMLGLTVGCARCHDHKYDPIPTADYYRLTSTFTTTVRSDMDIARDPAETKLARQRHADEEKALAAKLTEYERTESPRRLAAFLKPDARARVLSAWSVVEPAESKSAGGATLTQQPDGSLLASGKNPDFDTYTIAVRTKLKNIRSLRIEAMAHPSMTKGGPGRAGNGNFALSDVSVTAAPIAGGKASPVKLTKPRATFEQRGLPVAATIDKDARSAWAVDPQFGKDHAAVYEFAAPISNDGGSALTITLKFENNTGHNIGRPRISLSEDASPPVTASDGVPSDVKAALAKHDAGKALSPSETDALAKWHRGKDEGWRKLSQQLAQYRVRGPAAAKFKAMICSEGVPPLRLHTQGADFLTQTHFLERGDPNQKKGVASQSFLAVLMRHPDGAKHWQQAPPKGWRTSYRRRSLANWMCDAEYGAGHLMARVIVNRLWQHHFGRGIVATPSDFGSQGDRPTHPELLDYLASDLIANGWHLKPIHRLIVTSATYRQSTAADTKKAAIDHNNKYLWRRTPRRLEAEAIRDSLLAVAGQLDRNMGGPGSQSAEMPRRSVYFFVKRSKLNPMMTLFDAPDGTVGIEARTTTTIAPQSLLLMNSPVVRSAAKAFAGRLAGMKDEEAVRRGYALAVGREPTKDELEATVAFLGEQRASYQGKADAAALALADLCQVLLGLNEFVYVD